MSEQQWIWQVDRVIPSNTSAANDVLEELVEQLARCNWGDRDRFGIQLAVHEALINAIVHGNHMNESKRVQMRCRLAEDLLHVEIADEGAGFKPSDVPDPTTTGRIGHPGGRGVMLMREFMSSVVFNKPGNRVTLEKLRSSCPVRPPVDPSAVASGGDAAKRPEDGR